MNTLALNFGYLPYTDLDARPGFDPRSTPQLLDFLLVPWPVQTVFKSHHQVEMLPLLSRLVEIYEVFYVVRDPRDALLSFWRYIASCGPETGPRTATVGEFLRAVPSGRILRYQRHAAATMADRWRMHVEGWLAAANCLPGLTVVRYGDLDERFEPTVARLAAALGRPVPEEPRRPSPRERVIHPGEGGSGKHRALFTAADQAFVLAIAGETMARAGLPSD